MYYLLEFYAYTCYLNFNVKNVKPSVWYINYVSFLSNFQAVEVFLNGWTIEELMGLLFGAGMDWSDVDDPQPTTVSP